MARSHGNDYFKMFLELIDYSCKATTQLAALLKDFKLDNLDARLVELHKIEHAADEHKHGVIEKLSREFITPIEREDIMQIIRQIDDITDAVEDVLIKIYMYHVKTIRPEALKFCDIMVKCCEGLRSLFQEFPNFKKSKALHAPIVEVNKLEEEGDKLYMDAMRKLYGDGTGPVEVVAWSEVFAQLEQCCDLCEDTADLIEEIIMKNS